MGKKCLKMKQLSGENLQNIQELMPLKIKNKTKQIIQSKVGGGCKQTFLQRRHTDGQEAYEKMLNITYYQRDANQNYNEVSPHTGPDGHYQEIYKQ